MTAIPVPEIDNDFSNVAVQSDGTIIASGHYSQALTPQGQQNFDVLVAKFLSNGQLDVNFGGTGLVTTPISQTLTEEAYGMILTGGEIVVCGYSLSSTYLYQYFLLRYKGNGDLVTTFGNNGIVLSELTDGTVAYDMALDADGRILVTGNVGTGWEDLDFFLAAYDETGSLDLTFGDQGMIRTDVMGDFDEAYGITVQPDNTIVLAGKGSNGSNNDAVVMRFTSDMATAITRATHENRVSVYPNPVLSGHMLNLQLGNQAANQVNLDLIDSNGRSVYAAVLQKAQVSTQHIEINLPTNLATGLYVLKVAVDDEQPTAIRLTISQ
jgi:uncharacterized delta-60 repeat protein